MFKYLSSYLKPILSPVAKYLSIFIFTIASWLKTEKPCKNPLGMKSCLFSKLSSSKEMTLPKLGLPTLKSTATSKIFPCNTLTSFDCAKSRVFV